jgi:hypothetical protein
MIYSRGLYLSGVGTTKGEESFRSWMWLIGRLLLRTSFWGRVTGGNEGGSAVTSNGPRVNVVEKLLFLSSKPSVLSKARLTTDRNSIAGSVGSGKSSVLAEGEGSEIMTSLSLLGKE